MLAPPGLVPVSPACGRGDALGSEQERSLQLQKTQLGPSGIPPSAFCSRCDSRSLGSPLGQQELRPDRVPLCVVAHVPGAWWHRALSGKPSVLPRCLRSPPLQSHPEPRAWCQIEL